MSTANYEKKVKWSRHALQAKLNTKKNSAAVMIKLSNHIPAKKD